MLCGLIQIFLHIFLNLWIGKLLIIGLIKRGELLLSLDFLKYYDYELKLMNKGKEKSLYMRRNTFFRRRI